MKWNELLRNVPKVTPNYNFSASPNIFDLDVNYQIGVKTITFTGNVRSAHTGGSYSVIVSFSNVEPTEGLKDEEILQGYMPKPSLNKHDVHVRCNCPSYRFRFDKANRVNRASMGKNFGAYHRLTNRAPNNPHDLPGLCYHIIEFVDYLQSQGFIY